MKSFQTAEALMVERQTQTRTRACVRAHTRANTKANTTGLLKKRENTLNCE